jgi:hypothetical protein
LFGVDLAIWVDEGVDDRNGDEKLADLVQNRGESGIVDTNGVDCTIASLYSQSELSEIIGSYFSFDVEGCVERRAEALGDVALPGYSGYLSREIEMLSGARDHGYYGS